MREKKIVDLRYCGVNSKRYMGEQLHHWLSKSLFELVLSNYLPTQQLTQKNIAAALKSLKGIKAEELELSLQCYYCYLIAEATRVDDLDGVDYQAQNKELVPLIKTLFDRSYEPLERAKNAQILQGYLSQENYLFDDRITHKKLEMNAQTFKTLKQALMMKMKKILNHIKNLYL